MDYEEVDKSVYETDVFTGGAKGRYAKAKTSSPDRTTETVGKTSEKKKRAPKVPPSTVTDESVEPLEENGHTAGTEKRKKKSRKTPENGTTIGEEEATAQVDPSADGEIAVKPKKKRAPKAEANNENIDPTPTAGEETVKKKKSKAPKAAAAAIEDEFQTMDSLSTNDFEASVEAPTKVKKSKKHRTPKTTTDTLDETQLENVNSEFNENAYGSTAGEFTYDDQSAHPIDGEQADGVPEKSEYESSINDAFSKLGSEVNFAQYVGDDQWCIIHKPKSARVEPKSRIRKILPGGKDHKPDGRLGNKPPGPKPGLFRRLRTGVQTLVSDENNLIFGERSNFDVAYYDEEGDDEVDTDDLHRYAQKLRELEDNDREINPEFLVLRNGKTTYGVHETDAEGNLTFQARKPIYDRHVDQRPDELDSPGSRKIFARLKNPFNRNKDKDGKGGNSPKSDDTPVSSGKRASRKSNNKAVDDVGNNEPPPAD